MDRRASALDFFFESPSERCRFVPEEVGEDGIAVLAIKGPLEREDHWLWTSYECLAKQIEEALKCEKVRAIALRFDSPGGVAAGMYEIHRQIRALSAKYGKRIVAHVEQACSAACHLAMACDEVVVSETGQVGAIGVILRTTDTTEKLKKEGVRVRYVTSGAHKADGREGQPVDSAVLAECQEKIDYLASMFFAEVAEAREMEPAEVEAQQARVFLGPKAVKHGLADAVMGWADFLAVLRQDLGASVAQVGTATARPRGTTSKSPEAKAMATKTLKLTKNAKDAATAVAAARKSLEKAATKEARTKASAALESSIRAQVAADTALSTARAGMTTTKHIKHEEKVTQHEPEEEEESSAESSAPSTEESSKASSAASSSASSSAASSEEEEEEGAAEGEEEKCIAAGWAMAQKAYKAATKGVDAYGIKGPKALLKLAAKATGAPEEINAVLGGLSAIPKRTKVEAKVAEDVEKIKAAQRKEKVHALVEKAKLEGRAPSKAQRADLRALGMQNGVSYLKSHIANLPRVQTLEGGGFVPRMDNDGNPVGGATTAEQKRMMAHATAGMSAEKRAAFEADFNKRMEARLPRPTH